MTRIVDTPLRRSFVPTKQGARRHYGSHPYFTKRAWNVVQEYIRHFTAPGDTVLDPFGGSGVTAVESLVLRRKAIHVDVSPWACFLARQTASAPVDLAGLREAFARVEQGCRTDIERIWALPDSDLAGRVPEHWYPRSRPLPSNADVPLVEDLFTPRMLHGLARLRAEIMCIDDAALRDLLRLAFSSTLARINRTFLSAANRSESRGGAAIFSLYRYKVAKEAVELPLWEQFAQRTAKLLDAKLETNQLIGDFFVEGDTARFQHGSATRLCEWIKPGSIDYIYTDPPYGAHIAYLDLGTMWSEWLGFEVTPQDRADEIIEGGQLRKSREDYHGLLTQSLAQMAEVIKKNSWLSLVFAHRDTGYWESLVEACRAAGFEYENTVVQPVGVVWSMHKKKNPLKVLSGELVLNFRRRVPLTSVTRRAPRRNPSTLVVEACERLIVQSVGAATEDIHHHLVPMLLEAGLLAQFSRDHGDITPLLSDHFDFDRAAGRWYLREKAELHARHSKKQLARYHIVRLLGRREAEGAAATELEVYLYLRPRLRNGRGFTKEMIRPILKEVAYCPDDHHWSLTERGGQQAFTFAK